MTSSFHDARTIADWRLATQGLSSPRFENGAEVVSFFGGVQAQDHGPAKWSLGLRTTGRTASEIETAYADGRIIRAHALRPTWHYLTPEDLQWVQGLTAQRVHTQNASYYRKLGLDVATLGISHSIVQQALEGGNHLTRQELGARLSHGGVEADGQRLAYIMMHCELEGLVCSGRPRSQHTYALVDEWVGRARSLEVEEALARLTLTYFRSHGPSTDRDFSWWSSLKLSDVRAGLAMVAAELEQQVVDDVSYWWAEPPPAESSSRPRAHLIRVLDEYVVGYRESRGVIDLAGHYQATAGASRRAYDPLILDGQVIGRWRRRQTRATFQAEIFPASTLGGAQLKAVTEEAERIARFHGQDLDLVVRRPD